MFGTLRAAAQQLGFPVNPPEAGPFATLTQADGLIAGHHVTMRRDAWMRFDQIEVFFNPTLDLGLSVEPIGQRMFGAVSGAIYRLFTKADMQIGDAALDKALVIHGDEDARVAPLLEAARRSLLEWHSAGVTFAINDACVALKRHWTMTTSETAETILADVNAVVFLASELEAARASLPVAAALAPHAEAFRAFAADRKLSLFTTPLAAWGAIDAFTFMARCVRLAPGSFGVEVALHFQDPAQNFVGSLRPSTSNDGPRTAPTGDPVFDNGFVVEGAGLAAALTAEARADVLELARTGHEVILGAAGLHLRATLRDQPYALEQHVEHALSAMRAIDSARRPATYR